MNLLLKSGREELMLLTKSLLSGFGQKTKMQEVESFVLFIGFPRSGHSLIGFLINQHPEILISHELDVLYYFEKYNYSKNMLYNLIYHRDKWFRTKKKGKWTGYDYNISTQSTLNPNSIKVLGDKKGGVTSTRLIENIGLLNELKSKLDLPLKLIFIARNPFDNIATRILRESSKKEDYAVTESRIEYMINKYFQSCDLLETIRKIDDSDVFISNIEKFIAAPDTEFVDLFNWLNVSIDKGFIELMVNKINKEESQTRHKINWPKNQINDILEKSQKYGYLKNYSFD